MSDCDGFRVYPITLEDAKLFKKWLTERVEEGLIKSQRNMEAKVTADTEKAIMDSMED